MTVERRQFSEDERARIEQGIERVFTFVQDVLDDPAVLDNLPERAGLELTPIEEAEEGHRYDAQTRHLAVTVKHSASARKTRSA